jgi:hypothetical protein
VREFRCEPGPRPKDAVRRPARSGFGFRLSRTEDHKCSGNAAGWTRRAYLDSRGFVCSYLSSLVAVTLEPQGSPWHQSAKGNPGSASAKSISRGIFTSRVPQNGMGISRPCTFESASGPLRGRNPKISPVGVLSLNQARTSHLTNFFSQSCLISALVSRDQTQR